MTKEKNINSQPYWDTRFSTDWESMNGPNQSREFSWLALQQLPEWFFRTIHRDELTLVDWGCAQGDGTDAWASHMPTVQLHGVDFSETAIRQASQKYPAINFECENWLNPDYRITRSYDIVFSSNTLEHFPNPYEVLDRLTAHAEKAIVLLLPYQELQRIEEHEFTFLAKNIPTKLGNEFSLIWSRVSGPHKVWTGEQILLIYARNYWIEEQKFNLNDMFIDSDNADQLQLELQCRQEEVESLRDVVETLENTIADHLVQSEKFLEQIKAHETEARSAAVVAEGVHQSLQQCQAHNDNLQKNIATQSNDIAQLNNELKSFRASASWRVTGPLRATYSFISKLGTPLFLKLPVRARRHILHKINPQVHPIGPQSVLSLVEKPTQSTPAIQPSTSQSPVPTIQDDDLVIIAGVPFDDVGGGQRSAQLARCALKTGRRVTYIHIYKKFDFEINTYVNSHISIYGLQHIHIEAISPEILLRNISRNSTLLIELPHRAALPFLKAFNTRGMRTVFELIDDWETSLGGDWFDLDTYQEFVHKSQCAVGTAKLLVERLKNLGRNDALYLPNAANEYIFDKYKNFTRPTDLPTTGGIGLYFGSLYGEWFAWDFLEEAARKNPDISFVLIGDRPQRENLPKNICLLGEKRIEELPAYLTHADFAMLPFTPGKISDAVSPIKIFEYLFAEKPVISTNLPEIKNYPGLIIENNPTDFSAACTRVMQSDSSSLKNQNDRFIWGNSWFSRLDGITAKSQRTRFSNMVSAIILIHDNKKIIERTLSSLIHHCSNYLKEIIVVDNCSTDQGANFIREKFPTVRVIENSVNGCASGRNLGISVAQGEYIAFFDSDQWFTSSSCFEEALSILDRDANAGAIGWAAGWFDANRTDLGGMITDYCPNRAMNAQAIRKGYRSDIAYLGTGGFFIRTSVIKLTLGFDTAYDPTCFEDTDMSFQIKQLGFDICYRDLTGIRHQPHQTTNANANSDFYTNLFQRNADYFREKWAHRRDFFIDYTE